ESESLKQAIFLLFPRGEAQVADHLGRVGRVVRQNSLAVECAYPVLHRSAGNVAVNFSAWAAECGGSRGVQKRCQRSLDEIDVGYGCKLLLGPRLLVLAHLDLKDRRRFDVEVNITQGKAVAGGSIKQKREVIVLAVTTLKPETGAANHERIRRCAVARIGAVIGLKVSVRLELEFTVSTFDKKVLVVPSRGNGRTALLFFGRFVGRLGGLSTLLRGCSGLRQRGIYHLGSVC